MATKYAGYFTNIYKQDLSKPLKLRILFWHRITHTCATNGFLLLKWGGNFFKFYYLKNINYSFQIFISDIHLYLTNFCWLNSIIMFTTNFINTIPKISPIVEQVANTYYSDLDIISIIGVKMFLLSEVRWYTAAQTVLILHKTLKIRKVNVFREHLSTFLWILKS